MAITQNTYTGNGSTVLYSFAFPYLNTADVKVSLNGTITTAYTFANATTIQFNTAPANGAAIRIYRETNDASLQAVLSPGSSIRASDLNDNFDQLIYLGQEANTEADSATATANTALTNSATAISTANTASTNASAAVSTANTASANASAAVSTANTASTNASNAVSTANTASTNATTALNTANSATSTANSATSTANTALSTANTALTNANAAVSTANTASTNANNAVSTANTASTNATNAVNTANTASTNATTAVNTANSAVTTANAAAAAVANAVLYTTVANVAAIPGSPANNAAVEVTNSTGIESFTPLSGLPAGFVGSSGLSVRLIYQTAGTTWTWIQYFPNDPETRYFKLSGGTITGPITVPQGTVSSPGVKFSGTGNDNTGVYSPGIDELGLVTNGVNRLSIDSAGAVSIPGTLGVTGAVTGTSTVSGSALIPTGSSVPTNGVYLPAANTVGISTNASERLRITSAGLVGVGTSSPAAQLDIVSGTSYSNIGLRSTGGFAVRGDGRVDVGGATGANSFLSVQRPSGSGVTGLLYLNDADTSTGISVNSSAGFSNISVIGSTAKLALGNTGVSTQQVVLDTATGRLGIGTSSPAGTLHLAATYPLLYLTDTDATGSARSAIGSPDGNLVYYANENNQTGGSHIFYRNGANESVRIDSSGRVGIGSNAPSGKLEIAGTTGAAPVIVRASSSEGAYIDFYNNAASSNRFRIGQGYSSGSDNVGIIAVQANADLVFQTNTLERARIDSSGRLLVGTSTSIDGWRQQIVDSDTQNFSVFTGRADSLGPRIGLKKSRGSTASPSVVSSGDAVGTVAFFGYDGSTYIDAATIRAEVDGTPGTNDMPGRLVFSTTADGASSPTERMRIDNVGRLLVGVTSNNPAFFNVPGTQISSQLLEVSGDSQIEARFNRKTSDGGMIEFLQDGTVEGSISVSGTTVSYNGAHLSRWSQLPSGAEREEILRGSVLSNIDEMCEWGDEDNEQLNRMKVSDVEGDKNVSGVFQAWDDDDDTYTNDFYCAMTGDFIIRIAAGVTVERGDLLMSAGDGTAKPQDDDIIRSKTIAKVTSTNVSCTYEDGSYCVPCVLMAC